METYYIIMIATLIIGLSLYIFFPSKTVPASNNNKILFRTKNTETPVVKKRNILWLVLTVIALGVEWWFLYPTSTNTITPNSVPSTFDNHTKISENEKNDLLSFIQKMKNKKGPPSIRLESEDEYEF